MFLGIITTSCNRCEREDFKPERVFTIEGNILNPDNGEPISGMMLRLQGPEAGSNTKWAIDKDTTDDKGYFKLQYTKKDVFVFSDRTTTVYHEDPNHIGLPNSFIRSTDTLDISGEFCFNVDKYVPIKFSITNFNHVDSIYVVLFGGSFLKEYSSIPKREISNIDGHKFQVSCLAFSKDKLERNGQFSLNQSIGTYFFPKGEFGKITGILTSSIDSIHGIYEIGYKEFPDSSHLSDPRIIYEPLTSCLEEKFIELDCAKL